MHPEEAGRPGPDARRAGEKARQAIEEQDVHEVEGEISDPEKLRLSAPGPEGQEIEPPIDGTVLE